MTKGFLCVLDALRSAGTLPEERDAYKTEASASFRKAGLNYPGTDSGDLRRKLVAEHRPRSFPLALPEGGQPGARFELRFNHSEPVLVEVYLPLLFWRRLILGQKVEFAVLRTPYERIFAPHVDDRFFDSRTQVWASNTVGWRFMGGLMGQLWIGNDRTEYWSGRPIDALAERFDGQPLERP